MNPYEILGVKETDSDETIKKAYLRLVKKYHPDQYRDNPLSNLAQEKLKEINEAYDMITRQRQGRSGGYNSSSSYSSYSSTSSSSSNTYEFTRVRTMLQQNNIEGAAQLLNSISTRNAEWYFLDGIIALRRGWYDSARISLGRAANMDPTNAEYRNAYNAVINAGQQYASNPYYTARTGNVDMCTVCQTLYCADCCCECMGGDLIRCC